LAQNWYATESTVDVEILYITAADEAPVDGKAWSETVPTPYNNYSRAWINISSLNKHVEIIIDGDVICPDGDTLNFGICGGTSKEDDPIKITVTITGADR
jgi:hypothetical protein